MLDTLQQSCQGSLHAADPDGMQCDRWVRSHSTTATCIDCGIMHDFFPLFRMEKFCLSRSPGRQMPVRIQSMSEPTLSACSPDLFRYSLDVCCLYRLHLCFSFTLQEFLYYDCVNLYVWTPSMLSIHYCFLFMFCIYVYIQINIFTCF